MKFGKFTPLTDEEILKLFLEYPLVGSSTVELDRDLPRDLQLRLIATAKEYAKLRQDLRKLQEELVRALRVV